MLHVKDKTQFKTRQDITFTSDSAEDIIIFIEFSKEVFGSEQHINIGVIYRVHDTDVSAFYENLNEILCKTHTENEYAYLKVTLIQIL